MADEPRLRRVLQQIDGRSYPAYRELKGRWNIGRVELWIDHVQGDPFAAPSRLRGRIQTEIERGFCTNPIDRMAAEDWLLRHFGKNLPSVRRGSGKSGLIEVYSPGPEIVRRTSLCLGHDGDVEVRFSAGLPARGRRVLGREAEQLLLRDLIEAFHSLAESVSNPLLATHVQSVRTQQALRSCLKKAGLVAFVGNGSILPRQSGISQAPLRGAVPFQSPPELEVTLETPAGPVKGLGISSGVSLIVGGGFHGKSTLLQAIQQGIRDHVPGDGRCLVVSDPDTVKVRAEDGRFVQGVDISGFLSNLPGGANTAAFQTDDASGSTSQAAAIIESIESGARLLLIDEDTSATNLLVRDERMRALVPANCEPITPFVQRVRQLWLKYNVSTLMVVGGVGDYLDVADQVILMNHWEAVDCTPQAKRLAKPLDEPNSPMEIAERKIVRNSLKPCGKGRIRARDERRLEFGSQEIDLSAVEQVVDRAQALTLGYAIRLAAKSLPNQRVTMRALLTGLERILADEGLDALSPFEQAIGGLIWPRRHEIAAAISRLRTLQISAVEDCR